MVKETESVVEASLRTASESWNFRKAVNEVTIFTAIHNIKSKKGSKTAGVNKVAMDK